MRTNNTITPIMRLVLDVNILMAALEHTGPVSDIRQLAEMNVPTNHPAKNSMNIIKGIAQASLSGKASYQVHITDHVMNTLQYKLGEWTLSKRNWNSQAVHDTMSALYSGIEKMFDLGWTSTTRGDRNRNALNKVVPSEYSAQPFDIDFEDRLVLTDTVAVAALQEWDNSVPTVTMLITNDGGLQGANDYMKNNYTSFAGSALEASVMVVLPKTVAGMIGRSSR